MSERPANIGHGVDWLSALSDALIHCLMSYLTARQAVQTLQTCTLSRRWRNLWRFAASLDVDSYMDDDSSKFGTVVLREMPWEELKNFATKLLQHHSAPILDRFRLRVSTYRDWHELADVRE
jgi:hypothetical protein